MTAIYAAPDQAAVFRELGALAAPGAELRLLEYADPHGRFAAATAGDPELGLVAPAPPARAAGRPDGRRLDRRRGPRPPPGVRALVPASSARASPTKRHEITREFGRDWYEFVAREYAGILEMVRAGVLGGVLVHARRT